MRELHEIMTLNKPDAGVGDRAIEGREVR
jgi:hypothetical protein